MISIEDFKKLDIRVGTITCAEAVPEADKLLRLEVDFGDETRQIVSGIREYFPNPEELIGRQAPFVVNLEPRIIRGLESQGMILAAHKDKAFALLHPHTKVPAGTPLS